MKFQDLSNQRFHHWLVIKRVRQFERINTIYECQCDCGTVKTVYSKHLLSGQSKSCGCQTKSGADHKQWLGVGELSGSFFVSIKTHATKGNRAKLDFQVSKEYLWNLFLEQNRRCALTNKELVFNFNRKIGPEHTASLDRIDSSKGYIEGNVQWIHKDVNIMKNSYDQQYFIDTCKSIADFKK